MKREVRRSFGSFRPQVTHLEDRLQPGSLLTGGASSLLFDSVLDRLSANQTPSDFGVATQTSTYEQSDLVLSTSRPAEFRLLPSSQETQETGSVSLSETTINTSSAPAFETVSQQAGQLVTVTSSLPAAAPVSQRLETVVNQGGGTVQSTKNYTSRMSRDTVEMTAVDLKISATNVQQAEVAGTVGVHINTCGGGFQEDDLYVSFAPPADPAANIERDTAVAAIQGSDGAQYYAGTTTRGDGSGVTDAYLTQRSDTGCATATVPSDGFTGFVGFEAHDAVEGSAGIFWIVGAAARDTGEVSPGIMQLDMVGGTATLATFAGSGNVSGIAVNAGTGAVNITGTLDPDGSGNRILAGRFDPSTFEFLGVTIGDGSVPLEGRALDVDDAGLQYIVGNQNDGTDEKGLFLQLDLDTPAVNYGFVWNTTGIGDRTLGPGYGCNGADVSGGFFYMGCGTGPTATFGSPTYNEIIAKVQASDGAIGSGYGWIWQVQDGNFWANDVVVDDVGFLYTASTISGPVRPSGQFDLDADVVKFAVPGGSIVDDIGYANPDEDTEPREEALSVTLASTADNSNVYVAGITNAPNFEPVVNACQATYGGNQDGFIAGLSQPF